MVSRAARGEEFNYWLDSVFITRAAMQAKARIYRNALPMWI